MALSGGVIMYQPTSASAAAWRGFMGRDSLILVLVPRGSSLPSRRASFLRFAFSVPSRIDRFEGVDQPGDWGEDRSSTTAFGYRDLEPSLPLTRNDNDTGRAHRHIIAVYVGHMAQARQIDNRSGDVFDRSGTMFEAARRRLHGLSSGARPRPQNTDALRSDCPASRADRFSCYANIVSTSGAGLFLNRAAET